MKLDRPPLRQRSDTASKKLNMAQPPLSQSLARLEASLGVRLLDRTRRSVSLTPAGEALLFDLKPAMARLDRALQMATRAASGQRRHVSVGFVSAAVTELIPRMMRELKSISPETEVTLFELSSGEQVDRLLDGRLDIGFIIPFNELDADIMTRPVARYDQLIAIPADWDLAAKSVLSVSDLKEVPFIAPPLKYLTTFQAVLDAECRKQGFVLSVSQEITRSQTALAMVSAGIGVTVANEAVAAHGFTGIAFRPLAEVSREIEIEIDMVWIGNGHKSRSNVFELLADSLQIM